MADFFSVQDISVCLGGRQILDHVSFSVDTPGRVIGLLGPNGGADMRAAALRALEQVGMAGLADRDYLTLSGGEKQLVILARTLVEDTKLLLFDEPDSSLDLGNKYRMVRMIMESVHGRPGKAGLICLHDPVLALACCDTLMLLKDGRLICTLQPKTDSVHDMEKAFSEIYGAVRLVAVADPEISNHKRLILLPLL